MKRFLFAVVAFCISIGGAHAYWQSRQQISAGGPYAGPGDIATTNIRAWWGLRGYSAAVAAPGTQPAINICDTATGAICTDIVILSNGNLDVATATTFAAANCTSSQCPIATMYDQSGANQCNTLASPCDVTQATNVSRPLLILNCQGSLPCLRNSGSRRLTSATNHAVINQPYSWVWAAKRTASFTTLQYICCTNGGNSPRAGYSALADTVFEEYSSGGGGTTFTATATDNNFHAVQNLFNAASSHINVDGVTTNGSITTSTGWGAAAYTIPARDSFGSAALLGDFLEFGVWGQDNTVDEAAIDSNIRTYWGF